MRRIDGSIDAEPAKLRLGTLLFAYWRADDKVAAWSLLLAILALTLGMVFMNVQINYWQNAFFNALQNQDAHELYHQLRRFLLLAGLWVVMSVYSGYLSQMLQIRWRRWLTEDFLKKWLAERAYYRMQFTDLATDNPDQRIAEDLRNFVEQGWSLFLGLANASVTLISFVGILWSLSGSLTINVWRVELTIDGYVVWVAVLYAVLGNWVAHRIGKPLIGINFARERAEADFRYNLIRFRSTAEGVALLRGETAELRGFKLRFAGIVDNWWQMMRTQRRLAWFTAGYGQLAAIVPYAVTVPRYFSGALALGGLMQTVSAFGYVRESLSWFINSYVAFSGWRAAADRVISFHDSISAAQRGAAPIQVVPDGTDVLRLDEVALARPSGAPLVKPISLDVDAGSRVVLRGPSGSGKSMLFRAIAGLWPFGAGRVHVPREFNALFLPQRPYFPLGSLREAMTYPSGPDRFTDEQIRTALRDVGLAELIARLDQSSNWSDELSGAEQQRIAFARALLRRPEWLFIDEGTGHLDQRGERALIELLQRKLPATTFVNIAGREQRPPLHDARMLDLQAEGSRYTLRDSEAVTQRP